MRPALKENGSTRIRFWFFRPTTAPRTSPGPTAVRPPLRAGRGRRSEGGFRVPAIIRWPGTCAGRQGENSIVSGLDWLPTFAAAAGNPDIVEELKIGKKIGDRTYKVHLDGFNQLDLITGKGPSKRHEIYYFTESTLDAVRIDDYKYRFTDQPNGWLGDKTIRTYPISPTFAWIPSSGLAGRTMGRKTVRSNTSIGSSSSSGALCSSSS